MEPVIVRRARRADIPEIFDVRTGVTENLLNRRQLEALGITEDSVAEMLETTHGGWCVDIDGRLAGFSMADKRDATIFALFVRQECEGLGAGRALLDAAVNWLRDQGHGRVTLTTDAGSRAFGFYTSCGWNHIGRNEHGELFELLPGNR